MVALSVAGLLSGGCGGDDDQPANSTPPAATTAAAAGTPPMFREVTDELGLPAPTHAWPDGTYATPEVTPGGVAFLDYDNDGRLDIYQVRQPPPKSPGRADDGPTTNRLFRQQPDGTFKQVPDAVAGAGGVGHGVAVGDCDNDGDADLYVTRYGRNVLYRNGGDGTFTDVTKAAGLFTDQDFWSSSAAFVDYDRDNDLDLYVCHFAQFDAGRQCPGDDGKRDYCGPSEFQGVPHALYRNNGDGTFADVTQAAGVTYPGRGWGVVCADLTGDGWVDVYVANDEEQQNLYVNQQDGTFVDEAPLRGVAYSGLGRPEAGMGVAVGDVANDGRLALFITHFRGEKNTLYVSPAGDGMYVDGSAKAGMAVVDLPYTGWGTGFADFDNDGALDVAVVNGRVARGPVHPGAKLGAFWDPYAEPNLLFRGDGKGRFNDATARGGGFTANVESTRGLALGDFDNDGRVDLVSNTMDNRLRLFRNVTPTEGNHWLTVRALTGKRDALGARVEVFAGGRRWTRLALAAYSYCSSNDPRAHFGLGGAAAVERIEVTWPDGKRERFEAEGVDRQVDVRQGRGKAIADEAGTTR